MNCPACGCPVVESRIETRELPLPLSKVAIKEQVDRCTKCGMEGDFEGANDAGITTVVKYAERRQAVEIIKRLGSVYQFVALERILGLPFGTFQRWASGDVSPEAVVILRILHAEPDIIRVADLGYPGAPRIEIEK